MLHAKPYIKAVAVLYPPASPSKLPPHLRTLQPEIFNPKTLHRPYNLERNPFQDPRKPKPNHPKD